MTRRLLAVLLLSLAAWAEEAVDLDVVHRIQQQAFTRSKVQEHLFHISDVAGPRLTNSPAFHEAAAWIEARLRSYGIANVRRENWGPFGPGWECTHFAAHLRAPEYAPLLGFPLGWSQPTPGKLRGQPVLAPLGSEADFVTWKGKLRGRIVLTEGPRDLPFTDAPPAHRLSAAELAALETTPDPPAPALIQRPGPPDLRGRINQFLTEEGAALLITPGLRGDLGTIMAKSVPSRSGTPPLPPPAIAIAVEQFNRIARLLAKRIPAEVEVEIGARFVPEPQSTYNVVAEIPGTDRGGELVITGAHLDSWNSGTGAVDDGSGCAVVIEAARILKALNLPMKRTVRFAFWAAEEHGLLGSKAYLEAHRQELPRVSVYLNADGGAGRVRGIFLQGNSAARVPFAAWFEPFRDLGAATISPRSVHGSDHDAFDAAGIPAFQFIQDPLDYFTRAHHSNQDLYERAPAGDMMQTAAILASFIYHAANRPEPFPRAIR